MNVFKRCYKVRLYLVTGQIKEDSRHFQSLNWKNCYPTQEVKRKSTFVVTGLKFEFWR